MNKIASVCVCSCYIRGVTKWESHAVYRCNGGYQRLQMESVLYCPLFCDWFHCIDYYCFSCSPSFLAVGSRDSSCRIFSLRRLTGFHYVTLAAHRTKLVACFFEKDSLNVRRDSISYVPTVLILTSVKRPPLYKDHLVMYQQCL